MEGTVGTLDSGRRCIKATNGEIYRATKSFANYLKDFEDGAIVRYGTVILPVRDGNEIFACSGVSKLIKDENYYVHKYEKDGFTKDREYVNEWAKRKGYI